MPFRSVLDEHVEPQVGRYLEQEGHYAVHVRDIDELGAGTSDSEVAAYSQSTERHILTNDDDFFEELTKEIPTMFFYPNQRLAAYEIVSIIEIIEHQFTAKELEQRLVVKVVEGWL